MRNRDGRFLILLEDLRRLNIRISLASEGRIRVKGDQSVLTDYMKTRILEFKPDLIAFLESRCVTSYLV